MGTSEVHNMPLKTSNVEIVQWLYTIMSHLQYVKIQIVYLGFVPDAIRVAESNSIKNIIIATRCFSDSVSLLQSQVITSTYFTSILLHPDVLPDESPETIYSRTSGETNRIRAGWNRWRKMSDLSHLRQESPKSIEEQYP